jgi:hypothetical protein
MNVVVAYGCTGVVSFSQTSTGAVIDDPGNGFTLDSIEAYTDVQPVTVSIYK